MVPLLRELTLDAQPSSVRRARQFFVGIAENLALDSEHILLGQLAVSELVTNAVLYAGGPIRVRICTIDEALRVEVSDPNPEPPITPDLDPQCVGGRGLAIVAAVAGEWCAESDPVYPGKSVWFTLPLEAADGLPD